jgi:Single-strand binding protein family
MPAPSRKRIDQPTRLLSRPVAGNLTEDPEVRSTESGIARAMFRVAVSRRREQEPSFFTVVMWRDQAEQVAEELRSSLRKATATPTRATGPS